MTIRGAKGHKSADPPITTRRVNTALRSDGNRGLHPSWAHVCSETVKGKATEAKASRAQEREQTLGSNDACRTTRQRVHLQHSKPVSGQQGPATFQARLLEASAQRLVRDGIHASKGRV